MINPSGSNSQFPNNILQTGNQQPAALQQNAPDKRAEQNKPQENRSAEASTSQQSTGADQNRNFQEIAESIIASRKDNGNSVQPAIDRGAILDISV
jgi:hypothetical protein